MPEHDTRALYVACEKKWVKTFVQVTADALGEATGHHFIPELAAIIQECIGTEHSAKKEEYNAVVLALHKLDQEALTADPEVHAAQLERAECEMEQAKFRELRANDWFGRDDKWIAQWQAREDEYATTKTAAEVALNRMQRMYWSNNPAIMHIPSL